MKRFCATMMSIVLLFTFVPAMAEEPTTDEPTIGQRLDAWLEELNTWIDDTVEEVEKTAGEVSDWATERWDDIQDDAGEIIDWIKDKADSFGKSAEESGKSALEWVENSWKDLIEKSSEQTRGLKSQVDEWWDSLSEGAGELFAQFSADWNDLKDNIGKYAEMIAIGSQVVIRESLLETVSLVEDLAAEHDIAIPDNVRQMLDAMKNYAENQDAEVTELRMDEQALTEFLGEMGIDEETFQNQLSERFKNRLTKLGIEAESISLNEYMAENGISFSSAALRAQDRLNRYAAGTLEMTEEEYDKAVEILKNWVKEAGIDEEALTQSVLEYMENQQ